MEVGLIIKTILLALGIIVLYYVVGYFIYSRRIQALFKGVKSPPKSHWIFGSFINFPTEGHERVQFFIDICNKYGQDQGYVLLWGMFRKPMIVTCSPRVIGRICKSNEPKATGLVGVYRFMRPWLGEGLLIASGEKWARNRRLLTPAFHFEILKPYINVFNQSADVLVNKIKSKAESRERFEVFEHVCPCTLEIILKCAFSYSKDVQNEGDRNPYVKAVNRITDSLGYRLMRPLFYFDFFWRICAAGRQFYADCDFVHAVAEEIIDKRKESLLLDKSGNHGNGRYIDFLDILLKAQDEDGRKLTRREIRNEVDTFLFEGHDTTASAISWILYSLAENTEWQRKCQTEIDEIFGDRNSDNLEWSDLSKLEYLTMCIKEAMRLHSPLPVVSRDTTQEFDIGDRVVPKGTLIQINILAMNHMENLWGSDHMKFKPDRFSKENVDKIEHFQYVPFSAGPRNCIGQNFAMLEEKVVLSKLLRNFNFTLDSKHEVKKNMSAVMRTEDGMYMFAERRSF